MPSWHFWKAIQNLSLLLKIMSETWLYLMIKQTDCSRTFNEKPTWWIAGLMRKVATLAQIVQNLYEEALKLFTCVYPYFGIYYPIMTNIFNVEKISCKIVGRFRYKNSNSSSRNTLTSLFSVIPDESLRIRGHSVTTLTRFWFFLTTYLPRAGKICKPLKFSVPSTYLVLSM